MQLAILRNFIASAVCSRFSSIKPAIMADVIGASVLRFLPLPLRFGYRPL